MDDSTNSANESGPATDTSGELRTIAFRLRELQRLLGMRVVQENRRLEAEGLTPVTKAEFFKEHAEQDQVSKTRVNQLAEQLGELDLGDTVQVTLFDGTVITGNAGPIVYTPSERLRLELRSEDDTSTRYEVKSRDEENHWNPITVRRVEHGDDDWIAMGMVRNITLV